MSTHDTALRILPRITLGTHRSWRLVERNLTSSRDGWLVVVSGFFEPLFYLVALGIGVGASSARSSSAASRSRTASSSRLRFSRPQR